jgi:hypothetical protein
VTLAVARHQRQSSVQLDAVNDAEAGHHEFSCHINVLEPLRVNGSLIFCSAHSLVSFHDE